MDAGAVNVLSSSAGGLTAAGNQVWSQASPGVAGTAEAQDFLGNALAPGDVKADGRADLAVGVPGETFEDPPSFISEPGVVQVLIGSPGGLTGTGSQLWFQTAPGSPNRPRVAINWETAGHRRFQRRRASGSGHGCPGENLNSVLVPG
jgi:hypothetical protein